MHLQRIDVVRNDKLASALNDEDTARIDALAQPTDREFQPQLLAEIIEIGIKQHPKDNDALDQWLAPRLHYVVRLPRSVAADRGVWAWLASTHGSSYIRHRWPVNRTSKNPWWRYNGEILRNGLARLWWAAELVRDGPDYRLVPEALRQVRVFQNVGELRYSWHRETARAFTKVCQDSSDSGDKLSVVFNAYLAAQGLETFDNDVSDQRRYSWDAHWGSEQAELEEVVKSVEKIIGPNSGHAKKDVEKRIQVWLANLQKEIKAAE
jgi:hypothetical protein